MRKENRLRKHVEQQLPFQHPLVRDLAWALGSPPLIQRSDPHVIWPAQEWFTQLTQDYLPRLVALDREPEELCRFVAQQKDRRLGSYFETLWRFWLMESVRYQLLFANLPVRSQQHTYGEFDFLVYDRESAKTLHWEIAVKFYLGIEDTTQAFNWVGPAKRDRLDRKIERMLEQQSRLSSLPQARQLLRQRGIQVDESWLFVKGRLFYPHPRAAPPSGAGSGHARGFWSSLRRFAQHAAEITKEWLMLERGQWFAPLAVPDTVQLMDKETLIKRLNHQTLFHPICIAHIRNGLEIERGFLVPGGW